MDVFQQYFEQRVKEAARVSRLNYGEMLRDLFGRRRLALYELMAGLELGNFQRQVCDCTRVEELTVGGLLWTLRARAEENLRDGSKWCAPH